MASRYVALAYKSELRGMAGLAGMGQSDKCYTDCSYLYNSSNGGNDRFNQVVRAETSLDGRNAKTLPQLSLEATRKVKAKYRGVPKPGDCIKYYLRSMQRIKPSNRRHDGFLHACIQSTRNGFNLLRFIGSCKFNMGLDRSNTKMGNESSSDKKIVPSTAIFIPLGVVVTALVAVIGASAAVITTQVSIENKVERNSEALKSLEEVMKNSKVEKAELKWFLRSLADRNPNMVMPQMDW